MLPSINWNDIKSRLISSLIRIYFVYKTKMINIYTYYRTKYITNTDSIRGIDTHNNSRNLILRLVLISLLNKMIGFLNIIKNYYDVPCRCIEVNNNYYDKISTTLYTPKTAGFVTIENSLQPLHYTLNYEPKINIRIITQFKLGELCLKNYLTKYKDDKGSYEHTLDNILLINKHDVPNQDATIDITYFEKAKKKNYKLLYHEVKNRHINYFYNGDFNERIVNLESG